MVKYGHIYTGKLNVFKFLYVKFSSRLRDRYKVFVFAFLITEARPAATQAWTRI